MPAILPPATDSQRARRGHGDHDGGCSADVTGRGWAEFTGR
ncbi:MAG TPA: hypothetical protein VFG33_12065 [Kribbella sp.]|nr:hypothetical protein [Kribbella sp.]HET6294110.1 hypothetical protein [Kribbella sp.]